jgi:hypothetical protein
MPVVRVILHEGQEKRYYEAQASIHTTDRTLRIKRNKRYPPRSRGYVEPHDFC